MDDIAEILVDDDAAPDARIAKALEPLKAQLAQRETELTTLQKQHAEATQEVWRREQEAAERESKSAFYVAATERAAIVNAIAARESEIRNMQADLAKSVEMADGARAAELQLKLAEAVADRVTLRNGLSAIEENIERLRSAPAPKVEQPARFSDPFEASIANLPPKQREWVRQHKDKGYIKPGEEPSPKLLKAFYAAKAEGLDESSDKFFQYMDRELGHVKDDADVAPDASERFAEAPAEQKAKPAAKKPVTAAPVARDTNAGGIRTSKGVYRLTSEQTQTAERLGMTPEEYVVGLQEAIRRGKLPASALQ